MWKLAWCQTLTLLFGAICLAAIPGAGKAQQTLPMLCESHFFEPEACNVGGQVIDASVFAQRSRNKCIVGSTVKFTQTGIEVSGGCRAYFNLVALTNRPVYSFGCSSDNLVPRVCPAPEARAQGKPLHAGWVGNRESNIPCRLGIEYFVEGDSIRVAGGCRAQFFYTVE